MAKKLLLLLFLLQGLSSKPISVIWVHGTLPYNTEKKPLNWKMFKYFPFQPKDKNGLVKIDPSKKTIPSLYANLYKDVDKSKDELNFHVFSWNGRLSKRARKKASKQLYHSLKKLDTSIYLITHSHGGNIALHLAEMEKKFKKNLKIEKLLLFGTPIQSETSKYVTSSIFDKIYNVYSKKDPIQVLDFISTRDFFSGRKFKIKSDNLAEVCVKVNKKSPTHEELWHLGKLPLAYRNHFPLYPLPVCILTPLIFNLKASGKVKLDVKVSQDECKLSFHQGEIKTDYEVNNLEKLKKTVNNWI